MCDINGGFVDLNDSDDDSVASFATAASPEESNGIKCSELLPHEISSLEQKLQRIVVIQQTDQSYHMAINDIRDQAIISVLVEPSFYGRHCNMNVIIIATANNTYVFDLKALGGIFPELLSLFNAAYPKKIMHYSHRVCDQLYHQHKLIVNGICDTFVALCVVRQNRSILSLRDAISMMFNIPMSELTCEEIDGVSMNINCYYYFILIYSVLFIFSPQITESKRNFTARPLSRGQLQYLAKIAILQQKLHDRLIYGNICVGLQEMSSKLSCQFKKNRNSDQVALNMNTGSNSGFENIDPFYEISSLKDKNSLGC